MVQVERLVFVQQLISSCKATQSLAIHTTCGEGRVYHSLHILTVGSGKDAIGSESINSFPGILRYLIKGSSVTQGEVYIIKLKKARPK